MGMRLKRIRRARKLSQPQLARAAGIPVSTLRSWEQDQRDPLLPAAIKLARALKVTLDVLCGLQPFEPESN